jgi:hypothetical protein
MGPVYGDVQGIADTPGIADIFDASNVVGDVSGLRPGDAAALARGVVGLNGRIDAGLRLGAGLGLLGGRRLAA